MAYDGEVSLLGPNINILKKGLGGILVSIKEVDPRRSFTVN
jgi:hypothetical protein